MPLYLVATPIGNLEDITFRAVRLLKEADLILCEDTRHSRRLLDHYEISAPLLSYHKFNEARREEEIVERLERGEAICLISDAGTPAVADPAQRLVAVCVSLGLTVNAIPGPCAAIAALTCSGLPTDRFQFLGFLGKKEGERRSQLLEALEYQGTSICYESPKRLLKTLGELESLAPNRPLAVCRELTKLHEECVTGIAAEVRRHWENGLVKGEVVLLIGGRPPSAPMELEDAQQLVARLESTYGLSTKEAIKLAASLGDLPKKLLYLHRFSAS